MAIQPQSAPSHALRLILTKITNVTIIQKSCAQKHNLQYFHWPCKVPDLVDVDSYGNNCRFARHGGRINIARTSAEADIGGYRHHFFIESR